MFMDLKQKKDSFVFFNDCWWYLHELKSGSLIRGTDNIKGCWIWLIDQMNGDGEFTDTKKKFDKGGGWRVEKVFFP